MSKKKLNWKLVAQTAGCVAMTALEVYVLQEFFKLGVKTGFAIAKATMKD
jgi:hypothetical protein